MFRGPHEVTLSEGEFKLTWNAICEIQRRCGGEYGDNIIELLDNAGDKRIIDYPLFISRLKRETIDLLVRIVKLETERKELKRKIKNLEVEVNKIPYDDYGRINFECLTRNENIVLNMRGSGKTLKESGKAAGVSTERARQIVSGCFRKLSRPSNYHLLYLLKDKYFEFFESYFTSEKLNKLDILYKQTATLDSIHSLGMVIRTTNCLLCEDILLIKQLTELTENDLLKIPNLGKKSINEIKAVLAERNLSLREK